IREKLQKDYEKIDREKFFISVNHPYFLYEKAFNILGAEEFLYLLAANEDIANNLLDIIFDFELGIAEEYVKLKPDHINTSDDYGMQDRLVISPEMWRKYFKPRLKNIYDFYKTELGDSIVISHHSCGHVMPILEDLIEIGVKILNPLQTTANDLIAAERICRHRLVVAGAIDGQNILPFGSPEEVRKEVFTKLEIFWHNGGYLPMPEKILGVPDENLTAMENAIREWSKLYVEKI
ncbi:MAG TPA: uroporphyrinogen decarboxylase family protein, partial [Victivallales bacterium]|nr:uroporphyrinogen decarboxylase family protein [Victivallales bacterium]